MLVTLIVLWKIDVIYVNVAAPVEKSKEILGKDEVSVLLELEYPKLGDDLQVAYTMYGKPKYESINQKDFVLQKEENKEIYIKHNEENQIESFDFFVKGDKDKFQVLGEKLLPTGSSFLDENHEEEEKKNDTFRYTSIEYKDSYYYRLPEEQGIATIVVSNRVSELFEESKKDDAPSYNIEVSLMTDYEFNNLMSSRQISDDEATISVHEETNSDNGEASEYTNTEMNAPIGEEFDEAAIASNNEKIKHPDFLPNAQNGVIAGINISLKGPIGPIIENQIGQPDWRIGSEGGYILMYKDYQAGFGVPYDYEEYPESLIHSYHLPIYLKEEEIIQSLGEPISKEFSEVDNGYYMYYQVGDYELFFEKDSDDPAEGYYLVRMKGRF